MDRDTAVARIQQGLGFRDDLTNEIVGALQEARRYLETGRSLPDFLLQESQTLAVPAGSTVVSYPSRFLREFQEEGLWYVQAAEPDSVLRLEKLDFEIGNVRFQSVDPGPPVAYATRQSGLVFWPTRDIAYTLHWSFYRRSVALSTNVSNNEWLADDDGAPEALIGRAGMIIASDLNDKSSFDKFASMYSIAWAAIDSDSQLVDEENRPLAMGSRL
jgi:hypothetical protein